MKFYKALLFLSLSVGSIFSYGQNPLFIPPSLTGTNFNLNVQAGTTNFYGSILTPTYGINGSFLSPTLIVNKGDIVTLNVINNLTVQTTMHWHGLHVAPMNDGGPHQIIPSGSTWSPTFEILNNAGTFWYHPHGEGKTDLHVSKGLAGMIIIHDPAEQALGLPSTYGIDDFPLIVQSKAFDITTKIAIANHMDTALFVNGTIDPYLDAPAQVIRLRLLNGSSMRTFNFGFSNNMTFSQIATDGGLIAASNQLTRLQLAPGERSEILVDLSSLNGQTLQLMSYSSEIPNGVYGSPLVGIIPDVMEMYMDNFLNGMDVNLLEINVVNPTVTPVPVTSIPSVLVPYVPYNVLDVTVNRELIFDTIRLLPADAPNIMEGPFAINGEVFNHDSIEIRIPLNSTEIWTIINKTLIAHPFHIHDIQFNIIKKNGIAAISSETGWKDVVLVMPGDSVQFITKFITFSDSMTPYMYHCHILHHEDDGMMGSFIVFDPNAAIPEKPENDFGLNVFPNPTSDEWNISGNWKNQNFSFEVINILGEIVFKQSNQEMNSNSFLTIPSAKFPDGIYLLQVKTDENTHTIKLIKE